jgi:hypothetical protein
MAHKGFSPFIKAIYFFFTHWLNFSERIVKIITFPRVLDINIDIIISMYQYQIIKLGHSKLKKPYSTRISIRYWQTKQWCSTKSISHLALPSEVPTPSLFSPLCPNGWKMPGYIQ